MEQLPAVASVQLPYLKAASAGQLPAAASLQLTTLKPGPVGHLPAAASIQFLYLKVPSGYGEILEYLKNMLLGCLVQKRPCRPVLKMSLFLQEGQTVGALPGCGKNVEILEKNMLLGCLRQERPCWPMLKLTSFLLLVTRPCGLL